MAGDEKKTSESSEQPTSKRFWSRRRKFFAVLLGLVAVGAGYYCYRDKPLKLVQTTEIDRQADPKTGEVVDYRFAFNATQDSSYGPAEENGYRLILQALGPKALQQYRLAATVPWEEFPTNAESKSWFENEWIPLCEKFKLDPLERPTMFDRLDLWNYLGKYGLTGNEPEPDPENNEFGTYRENFEERPAKTNQLLALKILTEKPWTAKEFPNAAKWFEENADFFDLLARAARFPRFGVWRFMPDLDRGGALGTSFPDLQSVREFARLLNVRVYYRVGEGDISGAIDDVETITLIGRAYLETDCRTLMERLVGIALLGIASAAPIFENPDVAPSPEDLARLANLRAALWRDGRMRRYAQSAYLGEKRAFTLPVLTDFMTARRSCFPVWKSYDGLAFELKPDNPLDGALMCVHFSALPVNDAKVFQIFERLYDEIALDEDHALEVESELRRFGRSDALKSAPEKTIAFYAARLLLPALGAAQEAFRRTECVLKESAIATAFMAYYLDHGTLPPAFSVDASGRPLHSWRVLILPYLGDDAKALYDQIRLNEPWDSDANATFHAQTPDVFRCPSMKELKEGETSYSVLLGDEGFFDESGVGKDFKERVKSADRDAWSQALLVERGTPVCWMRPDAELQIADFIADGKADVRKFFADKEKLHGGGMDYSTISGATRYISETTTDAELDARLRGLPVPAAPTDETEPSAAPDAEESTLDSPPESESDAESKVDPA